MRHPTAADKQVIALEAELAVAKDAHSQLVNVSARSEADCSRARADLETCKARLSKVERASKLAKATLDDARKHSVESPKAAQETLHLLTKM